MNRPTIETSRLILRPFVASDAREVQRLAGSRTVADGTLNIPHPYPDGAAEVWIATHQGTFDEGRGITLAITRRSDGALLGAVSLMDMTAGHQAELGYCIGEPFWNHGYCTEATRAVLEYAFGALGLMRVYASHFSRNPSSGRVMRKIGMKYEGCRRSHVKKWDQLLDLDLYGILREERSTAD